MNVEELLAGVRGQLAEADLPADALDRLADAFAVEVARAAQVSVLNPHRVKHDLKVVTEKGQNADGVMVERTASVASKTECPDCGRTLVSRTSQEGITVFVCGRLALLSFDVKGLTTDDIVACGEKSNG